jgi:hypothetical protein
MKLPALSVLLATAFAAAQSPVSEARAIDATAVLAGDHRVPVHGRDGDPEYGLWAAGRDYKASFHDGMTFVPYLGREYPHNQPFAWRTTSVRVGEQELLVAGQSPRLQYEAYHVAYDHGAVVETYDVLAAGLEQRFVLAERPRTNGALRIQGALTTALWSPVAENAHQALVFRDAKGRAILSYGAAIAIDADGDRFAMTTSQANGVITLTLPAADVARADFPLVVDPLLAVLGSFSFSPGWEPGEIDIAHDGTSNVAAVLTAFTREASATDFDVSVRAGTSTGSSTGTVFADLSTLASADRARCAYVAGSNRWAVVYQSLVTSTQQMQIRGVVLPGNPSAMVSNSIPHLVVPGTHEWRPEVGGVLLGGTGNRALVVCQREAGTTQFANTANSTVWGLFFDTTTANGTWSADFLIQGNATDDTERPSVNRASEGGSAYSWLVVCQAFTNNAGNDDWDLFGRLVNQAGAVSAQAWISSLGTTHKLGAQVAGCFGRYAVLFSTANTSIGKNLDVVGTELRLERLDWPHGQASQSASGDFPVLTVDTRAVRTLEPTGIAHDHTSRCHWMPAWRNSSTSPAIYATRVGYSGQSLQSPDLVQTTGFTSPGKAVVLFSSNLGYTTILWPQDDAGSYQVWRRRFDQPAPSLPSVQPGTCNNLTLSWTGPSPVAAVNQRIGSAFCGPRVQGAGANDLHLMLLAIGTANVPIAHPILGNGCTLLVPFTGPEYIASLPPLVGNDAQWTLPLPEALSPVTLYFQDWVLQANNGLFWGTGRLSVPLTR